MKSEIKYKTIITDKVNNIHIFIERKSFNQMYNDADKRIKKENLDFYKNFK